MRDKKGRYLKGARPSPNTEFKKGENIGDKHPLWTGGKYKTKAGYIMAYAPDHPKAHRGRVYEHILVAEKMIGRLLNKGECVHHINRIKDDNRPDNLIVMGSPSEHFKMHSGEKRKNRKFISKEYLQNEYVVNKKSIKKIASEMNISAGVIFKRIKEYSVPVNKYPEQNRKYEKVLELPTEVFIEQVLSLGTKQYIGSICNLCGRAFWARKDAGRKFCKGHKIE